LDTISNLGKGFEKSSVIFQRLEPEEEGVSPMITGSVKDALVWDWSWGSNAQQHTLSKLQAGGL
jgi:hypothetical protein